MLNKYIVFLSLILMVGCGYKPSSYYAKNSLGDKVSTFVYLQVSDPESSSETVDLINNSLVSKFKNNLSNSSNADTHIIVKKAVFKTEDLRKDRYGYTVEYRTTAMLDILIKNKKKSRKIKVSGKYDYSSSPNAVIGEAQRVTAIKEATSNAIDELISKISYYGYISF